MNPKLYFSHILINASKGPRPQLPVLS